MRKPDSSDITISFLAICFAFGLFNGFIGLGFGLVFMTVAQAIGLAILCTGFGSLIGVFFGSKMILGALVKSAKEQK